MPCRCVQCSARLTQLISRPQTRAANMTCAACAPTCAADGNFCRRSWGPAFSETCMARGRPSCTARPRCRCVCRPHHAQQQCRGCACGHGSSAPFPQATSIDDGSFCRCVQCITVHSSTILAPPGVLRRIA